MSQDKAIKLWDSQTGEHLRTLEGHSSEVISVAFSPYGGPLTTVSDNNTITPKDLHTTKLPPESFADARNIPSGENATDFTTEE